MKKVVAIGIQDFEEIRTRDTFYVDKTDFIQDWWNSGDDITLITRPRRFGKTLNMSMMNCFFSNKYAGRSDLFEGLKVWEDEEFRKLQGTFPVIFITFAGVKGTSYKSTLFMIKRELVMLYSSYPELYETDKLNQNERAALDRITQDMSDEEAAMSLNLLSKLLEKIYGKKVLIFLDEYDTPMQEAYLNGYWDQMTTYIRTLFNNTFKTNPSLDRAIMTGITRVSRESLFSDLNNLRVVTTTSGKYATAFGFTEEEVFQALEDQGFAEKDKTEAKKWYDGFTFGNTPDIYNPWSIINLLQTGEYRTWWANTSSNGLVNQLVRQGNPELKMQFETLLRGESIHACLDEEIVFNQLDDDPDAIWSLLLASGYLKVVYDPAAYRMRETSLLWGRMEYDLAITNLEVMFMFRNMVAGWFRKGGRTGAFARALLRGDAKEAQAYLNDIMLESMSSFDGGIGSGSRLPEKFYHGLVLGLLVTEAEHYQLKSNRESGYGRYDVVLEPRNVQDPAVIMEFKVFDGSDETGLKDTAANAIKQIEEKKYDTDLLARGVPAEHILKYGFAFRGRECLIVKAE